MNVDVEKMGKTCFFVCFWFVFFGRFFTVFASFLRVFWYFLFGLFCVVCLFVSYKGFVV